MTVLMDYPAAAAESVASTLPELTERATSGDHDAWNQIIRRFTPLVRSVINRHRLNGSDADDVAQSVWLTLFEHLKDVREPRALPGWISTTTRREALALISAGRRIQPFDPIQQDGGQSVTETEVDHDLLRAEVTQVVRDGLGALNSRQRDFLVLAFSDPEITYREIGSRLGIPGGSIGPTRMRCLNKLRETSAIRAFIG